MAHTVDLLYSDTERTLAAALADLLSSRAQASDVVARTEKPDTYDLDLWHTVAAEIGLAGLLIPEPLGGAGASYRELAAAAEQFGAAVAAIPYLGSAAVATAVLLSAAKSSAQRTESAPVSPAAGLLRRMADGELTAALAVPPATLPGEAFPSAVRVAGLADGGMTKLRGTIPAVADALPADVLLVPADGVPFGLYAVDAGAPGVARAAVVSLDATRPLCDLAFDSAPARAVATGAAAAKAVASALAAGTAVLASEQLGVAQRCLDMTVTYLKERRQFARPIGSFQALKHRVADVWIQVAQARAAARYAAACLADGDPDAPVAIALAKAACGDAAVHAAQECVQMHGGIGFTWEHPAHLYLKRAKAASIAFGTADAHRAALASLADIQAP
jgi:alkylation response protein AidB-like acyl-CoA dehydrogenase